MNIANPLSSWHLRKASESVRSGGVIAYPTEAVYGFGCDPMDIQAVLKLLNVKRRSIEKGLIVIASDIHQLHGLITFPNAATREKVEASWPGPNTWILPASEQCPYWLKGIHSGLAVRVSAHPVCKALCDSVGPIVSSSANVASKPALTMGWQLEMQFQDQIDYVLHASCSGRRSPSTIRDALTDLVLR